MILWQKRGSGAWLAAHEATLEQMARNRLAIIMLEGRATAAVQVACSTHSDAKKLIKEFGGSFTRLPRNWQPKAKSHPPIRIGRHLQIVSAFESSARHGQQLVIPVAGAFGTGEHATTAMSLRLLAQIANKLPTGWRLFDVGTGTGILALAARKLGADEVLGIDTDWRAIAHARRNAHLNGVGHAKFVIADILRWQPLRRYDLITANLYSDLLVAALPRLRSRLRSDGWLIASGILRKQVQSVARAFKVNRFLIEQQRRRGKWIALLCRFAT